MPAVFFRAFFARPSQLSGGRNYSECHKYVPNVFCAKGHPNRRFSLLNTFFSSLGIQ